MHVARHLASNPMRTLAAFAGGAVAGLLMSRVMPPLMAQAAGTAFAAAGRDPFDTLMQDHRAIRSLLDDMVASEDQSSFMRTQLLFRLKRRLAAHAMAEEDVVYPILRGTGEGAENTMHLYEEHAEMKILLYKLEQLPKNESEWRERAVELRTLIDRHVRQEEDVEFPRLREALDDQDITRLSAQMHREKSLLL
jgi:hemerythrin superfamily protein